MSRIFANFSFFSREPHATVGAVRPAQAFLSFIKIAGLIAVCGVLLVQAGKLWREWALLQEAVHGSRQSAVVGYLNIAPTATFVETPTIWYRDDGKEALLWLGWDKDLGHWFRFAHGEIDPGRLSRPTGECIVRAIDFPLVETQGGEIWQRIPPESEVVGHTIENQKRVYPVAILGKVLVINDLVEQHPYLVVENPALARHVGAFSIYDASLDGHRVTLAHTGYFQDGKPLLFDRGTESLWLEMHDGLTAIAGKHTRKRLMRVAFPSPVAWNTWVSRNPQSRLVVGADRSQGVPLE